MRLREFGLVVGWIVACGAACKKKDGGQEGAGGTATAESPGGGGPAPVAAAAGLEFEPQALEFGYQQFADSRKMLFRIQAQVPKGWQMMTEGESAKRMNTFMPAPKEGETPNLFTSSSFTISPTCNGPCQAAKLPEQMGALGKARQETHGPQAKLLQDGEVRPGVLAFVVEYPGAREGEKNYHLGASHLLPGQDYAVLCEALLQGEQAARWEAIRDACIGLQITSIDPRVGEERAKQERDNLAKCPASSSLKYTAKEPDPARDPAFESVPSTIAVVSQPGSLLVYLSGVPMASRQEFTEKELQPNEGVLNLSLWYNGGEGEVLSGTYAMTGEGPLLFSAGVRIAGGTTLSVSSGEASRLEVIARTPERICGRLHLEDSWRTITGEFVADIVPAR